MSDEELSEEKVFDRAMCGCEHAQREGFPMVALFDTMEEALQVVKEFGLVKGNFRIIELNGDDDKPAFFLHIKTDNPDWWEKLTIERPEQTKELRRMP